MKKITIPPAFWTDEDGERYFCEAHIGVDLMRAKALDFERECGSLTDGLSAEIEQMTTFQCWIRWDPDDEEAPGERVERGAPGAVPHTQLS